MSYTSVTAQPITRAGLSPTFVAAPATGAGNGISFSNNGRRYLRIKNAGGTACVVTVNVGATVDGNVVAGKTFTVPITTGDVIAGPWPPGDYNAGDGTVTVDFSFVTSVTVAVLEA